MKTSLKIAVAFSLAAITSACTTESLTRSLPFEAPFTGAEVSENMVTPDFRVQSLEVIVPEDLTVSEDNTIKPRVDIVWHEDPFGNRYAQVQSVMEEGLRMGTRTLRGSQPVKVEVELIRFHAQTDRVRYSKIPSEHEIEFYMTVTDARSGEVIIPARYVNATFPAFGGEMALAADIAGITQRKRITERLSDVIVQELTRPIPAPATM
ncbi:DUF6778 family protein [Celeribacter litoreus]|uniref:DUF6778 family protein n=1 Tax=Celeribacter litoreus TaxID=2876714 RepID=UPI001CCF7CF1|nr:DUF6778 family protein [Celeribacter litoreus]MCA0043601.1 hypothetical protein [Celeribacter litoreus]